MQAPQLKLIREAYRYGANAHKGQRRRSGEPYIHHPLEVAYLLCEMRMDHHTIVAALLHDVIEDTRISKKDLEKKFGDEVAQLVDGVSKLAQIDFASHAQQQALNFHKMIMTMSQDIRVILIKLADRLHNMRTLDALEPEQRKRIANETLEIHAPIATRLGMNNIRLELEELGFKYRHPLRYRIIAERVRKLSGNRKKIVANLHNSLKERMTQEGIQGEVLARAKQPYSIYRKMRRQNISLANIYDIYGVRIIVQNVDTCYRTLGSAHNLYKPVPGKFKDYIAIPKTNGYQSLHTVLHGPHGIHLEVQIRTREMEQLCESGIAAHWLYKTPDSSGSGNAHRRAREWLRQLMELQTASGNPEEFYEHVKVDLFPDSIYVFTPTGDILELPSGATPVDFAYAIHTDVGHRCVQTRINHIEAPLSTPLHSGQSVEIITADHARPNPAWLNFVVTARARSHIRHYLRNLKRQDAIRLGRNLLNRELLNHHQSSLEKLNKATLDNYAKTLDLPDEDALFNEIGLGNRLTPFVVQRLLELGEGVDATHAKKASTPIYIHGAKDAVVHFPKCCYPILGDAICGVLTAGHGIVVHLRNCHNLVGLANRKQASDRWVVVEWGEGLQGEFQARLVAEVVNRRGVLATVASTIAGCDANIENVEMRNQSERFISLTFILGVRDRGHLAQVMRRVHNIKTVSSLSRK
ncbi:MAG: RelA/SpoT family protein [Candidatus Eutrophobiaceae bacterium]